MNIEFDNSHPKGTKPLSPAVAVVVRPQEGLGLGPGRPLGPHHHPRVFPRPLVQQFGV